MKKQGNAKNRNNHHNKQRNQSSQKVYSCYSFTTHFKVLRMAHDQVCGTVADLNELNGSVNDLTKTLNKKVYAALYSEFLNMV